MEPLVTVIVPIYQIAPYLDQCVDSLVKRKQFVTYSRKISRDMVFGAFVTSW